MQVSLSSSCLAALSERPVRSPQKKKSLLFVPARWPVQRSPKHIPFNFKETGQALLFRGEEDWLLAFSREHRTPLLLSIIFRILWSCYYLSMKKMSSFSSYKTLLILWSHHVLVGHRAAWAEGDHWGSKDQEWRSTGCHTRSFEHPREHERSDNHRMSFCFFAICLFWHWLLSIPRPANSTAELVREHLQPQ